MRSPGRELVVMSTTMSECYEALRACKVTHANVANAITKLAWKLDTRVLCFETGHARY